MSGALLIASVVLIPVLGAASGGAFRAALDFTTGVLSLVTLSSSVAWGLLATDRLFMSIRQRLVAQAIHRATAVSSIGFLLVHITVKIAEGHTSLLGALIPFGLGVTGSGGLIGLGSLAAILMVVTAATGALRSAFANPDRVAGHWRAVHMLAYPAWCFALMHGLYAGRPAAGWVVTLYSLSLAGVVGALVVRSLPRPVQRRIARRLAPLLARVEAAQAVAPDASTPQPHPADPASPRYEAPAPHPYPADAFGPDPFANAPFSADPLTADPYESAQLYEAGQPRAVPGQPKPATGISAAYRAVSLAPAPPQYAPSWPTPTPRPPENMPVHENGLGGFDETAPLPTVPYGDSDPLFGAPSGPPPEYVPPRPEPSPQPSPFHQPVAGEPWHSPAGDRP
ncbi:hypothetical protein [Streptomyces sp. CBMA152]|uniref:hypothetical protein n=1 Tax=Streptomyces sp. CBMA152 TaxID=1896312 RepID=UPI001660EA0E|nr:hypothetical protein [Streptomyces sp. CBMA152]MBD0747270.1 hypothetical protein [Streptomyces sp. CBMA152]